ncbi:flagellar basal body rod protein FlgB [Desulfitobacterium sp. AusDCA]|uniref:flagellar basal body rod protein FlgB n=1 Tax=Desulfitobacterium sp. AusDCA TaxID=3240383 RepID=UPI003DA74145
MAGWLDGPMLTALEKGLDASSLRQKVLSDNVANVDTPNFKRSDVDFQTVLGSVIGDEGGDLPLKVTMPQHIAETPNSGQKTVVTDQSSTFRNDGNNVDIDREMANVAENGLYYNSVTQAITSQLGLLRMVIQGK